MNCNIYYIKSDKTSDIVNDYRIFRNITFNENACEGIKLLYEANAEILKELQDDIYYEERLKIEALNFFEYLICFQRRPVVQWFKYYQNMLNLFHSYNELLFKKEVKLLRNYKKKKDCIVVQMFDPNIKIHYKSGKELEDDFSKYRSEIILRNKRKYDWKIIDYEWILTLILA